MNWLTHDTRKVDFASKQNIVEPDAIVDCNENMGEADLLSCVIVPYSIQQKGGNCLECIYCVEQTE